MAKSRQRRNYFVKRGDFGGEKHSLRGLIDSGLKNDLLREISFKISWGHFWFVEYLSSVDNFAVGRLSPFRRHLVFLLEFSFFCLQLRPGISLYLLFSLALGNIWLPVYVPILFYFSFLALFCSLVCWTHNLFNPAFQVRSSHSDSDYPPSVINPDAHVCIFEAGLIIEWWPR